MGSRAIFLLLWAVELLLRLVQLSFVEAVMARSVFFLRGAIYFFCSRVVRLVAIRVRLCAFCNSVFCIDVCMLTVYINFTL